MLALLKHAKNFVNKDETRPLFNGIYFDGNRAIVSNTHLLVMVDNVLARKQIIHYKTCKEIEGTYPNVDNVIPRETSINFEIQDIHEWINALKISLAVTGKSDYSVCRLRSKDGTLLLETKAQETFCTTNLYMDVNGVDIYFNAKYLHDILVFFKDMEVAVVTVGINDGLKSIKLTTDTNVSAILNPIRAKW